MESEVGFWSTFWVWSLYTLKGLGYLSPVGIFLFLIWVLGKTRTFFMFIPEGQAAVIVTNEAVWKAVMSYRDHLFRHEVERYKLDHIDYIDVLETEKDDWDILPLTKSGKVKLRTGKLRFSVLKVLSIMEDWPIVGTRLKKMLPDLENFLEQPLGGLRFIGIPGIQVVHSDRFSWTSYEQVRDEKTGTVTSKPRFSEKPVDTIRILQDIYVSEIPECETLENLPVSLILLLTVEVTNPVKAFFRVEHWLEETQNQIRPAIRQYIGTQPFNELIQKSGLGSELLQKMLTEGHKIDARVDENVSREIVIVEPGILPTIHKRWGVRVVKVQIQSIELHKDYRELTLEAYRGRVESDRIKNLYGTIRDFGRTGELVATLETLRVTKSNLFIGPEGLGGLIAALKIAQQQSPPDENRLAQLPSPVGETENS